MARSVSSRPYRHHASSVRLARPTRTTSRCPARNNATLSVWERSRDRSVTTLSSSSKASHRSSIGARDQRLQDLQTAHRRPRSGSYATRVDVGKCSSSSFVGKGVWQTKQYVNSGQLPQAGWTRVKQSIHRQPRSGYDRRSDFLHFPTSWRSRSLLKKYSGPRTWCFRAFGQETTTSRSRATARRRAPD